MEGRVGAGVTGVELTLAGGRTVTASVGHGWLLAWWPSDQPIAKVRVLTRPGG